MFIGVLLVLTNRAHTVKSRTQSAYAGVICYTLMYALIVPILCREQRPDYQVSSFSLQGERCVIGKCYSLGFSLPVH